MVPIKTQKAKVNSVDYIVTLVVGIDLEDGPDQAVRDVEGELMRHVDDTMRELANGWIDRSGVELDLSRAEACFAVVVKTGDHTRAASQARGALSIAVHAAGGATPHRPFPPDAEWSVRLLETSVVEGGNDELPSACRRHGEELKVPSGDLWGARSRELQSSPQAMG